MKINADYLYYLAFTGFLGLFAWLMLWHTAWNNTPKVPVVLMLILTVTPLLLPMRGFLRQNLRSCAWLAYISLPYFMHGTAEVYANTGQRPHLLWEVVFSLMLFFGCTFFIRVTGRKAKS